MALEDREKLTRRIRESVDIVDLIGGYVALRRAGSYFKGLCPFHEEKTPSFAVHPGRQTFRCYGCNVGGDVFNFLQQKENVTFLEARRILADRAGISLDNERSGGQSGPGKTDLARANTWAQRLFRENYAGPAGESARQYVAQRGITVETAEAFGLGLSTDSYDALIRKASEARANLQTLLAAGLVKQNDRGGHYDTFRHRLMFPIVDPTDRIVGFGGRTLGDDRAKYLNTPATALFDKSSNVFGLDRARHAAREAGRIIVVEGYTDCMMAHQFGFAETVATLGTALTESHAALLRRYTDRLILLFDSDEAGQRAADRALTVTLTAGLDVSLSRVPEGKDPCDYLLSAGKKGLDTVLNGAIGALEFKWKRVTGQHDASTTGPGRRRALEEYLQQLAEWLAGGAVGPIQTGLLVNQLSRVVSVAPEDLHRQLARMSHRSGGRSARGPITTGASEQGNRSSRVRNAQQEALCQVLEVLLNEPGYYDAVAEIFNPGLFEDPALAAAAKALQEELESDRAFQVVDLIGRFESPAFGQLITELQDRGERRGNYDAVIRGAIDCLATFDQSQRAVRLAEEIRQSRQQSENGETDDTVPPGEDERLAELTASSRTPKFSPNREKRRFLSGA